MAKSVLLFLAGILVAAAPVCVEGGQSHAAASGQSSTKSAQAAPDPLARAKEIYRIDCAVCHGDNGNGKTDLATSMSLTLNDWTDPKSLADKSDADLFKIIREGKDKMPPEDAGRAKDDDVKNLVTYIRSFSKTSAASAPPAQK
ncbi:MAG TPA: cytochrome c [Terracidiphilus sp.]|jgi:mono/diheme cytochrome c family protein|nr:cytochrome c [Terracidiphilus sp.]